MEPFRLVGSLWRSREDASPQVRACFYRQQPAARGTRPHEAVEFQTRSAFSNSADAVLGWEYNECRETAGDANQARAAAAFATVRAFHSVRSVFCSALRVARRAGTPLYFFTVPLTLRSTMPWLTRLWSFS